MLENPTLSSNFWQQAKFSIAEHAPLVIREDKNVTTFGSWLFYDFAQKSLTAILHNQFGIILSRKFKVLRNRTTELIFSIKNLWHKQQRENQPCV